MHHPKPKPAPSGNSQPRNAEASAAQIAPNKRQYRIGSLHRRLIRELPPPPQSDFYDDLTGCLYFRTSTTRPHPVTRLPVFIWFRRTAYDDAEPIPAAYLSPTASKSQIIRALAVASVLTTAL